MRFSMRVWDFLGGVGGGWRGGGSPSTPTIKQAKDLGTKEAAGRRICEQR